MCNTVASAGQAASIVYFSHVKIKSQINLFDLLQKIEPSLVMWPCIPFSTFFFQRSSLN